jgi:DNA-binding response OmpR family regulator
VLVVDQNPGYRSVICHVVEMAGCQFESVAGVDEAMRQLDGATRYEMVIVGLSADSPAPPERVTQIRLAAKAPVIVLTESYDEVGGTLEVYKAGADQVLPKPFVPDALMGAIQSEMRRPGPESVVQVATRLELGPLVFDASKRTIAGEAGAVSLTKREWQLLAFLLASPNQFFSADEVALRAWGPEASLEQLRSYVTRLRQKMARHSDYCTLVNEKGKGYALALDLPVRNVN